MATVGTDLDKVQRLLGDAVDGIGSDGRFWSRAELLTLYNEGYRMLLTQSQAVRQWTILDVPGRFTVTGTAEWEARHANGGSCWKWTWSAPGYECSSLWEVQFLEGVTPQQGSEGVTQQWERAYYNPTHVPYRFALPRNHERVVAMYYDHERLEPVTVGELDATSQHWMSLGGWPLAWTPGVGRGRTFEIYEIVTTYSQGYNLTGSYGIPRQFSGSRTYTTADSNLYGIPRTILSPDRQYLVTTDLLGRPVSYHSADGSLLILEVVGPEIPAITEGETPSLIPAQMQKYLRYFTLARAWEREGEGQQPLLSQICHQRFQRGVQVLKHLSWLTRKDTDFARQPIGGQARSKPPRPRLPASYPRVW